MLRSAQHDSVALYSRLLALPYCPLSIVIQSEAKDLSQWAEILRSA